MIQYIWMQILNDLGFSRYIVPLLIIIVIFRKEIIIGSRSWRKLNFQAWTLIKVHYISCFQAKKL